MAIEGRIGRNATEESRVPGLAPASPPLDGKDAATPAAAAKQPGLAGVPRRIVVPLALLVVALAVFLGYRTWDNATRVVWTDNAQVAGTIVPVGPLTSGRVAAVYADVGDHVRKGQVVATVAVPQAVGATAGGTPKLDFTDAANQTVDVTAPLTGVVVARLADPGSAVQAGQTLLAVIDPTALYVSANVNETDVGRIQVGQPVDVTVDSLGMTLPGRVAAITPASAASFSLLPQQNASGNFTKVAQVMPVKIAVDYGTRPLMVGSSVEVAIHVK